MFRGLGFLEDVLDMVLDMSIYRNLDRFSGSCVRTNNYLHFVSLFIDHLTTYVCHIYIEIVSKILNR